MAYYYHYRKNGGEVLSISTASDEWTPDTYFGVYENALHKDLNTPQWCDGTTIRDATESEIANFPVAAAADVVAMQQNDAKNVVDATASYKNAVPRMARSIVEVMIDELNTLRAEHSLSPLTLSGIQTALKNKIDAES